MKRLMVLAALGLAVPVQAAELAQIPAIVAGKKPGGADWKAAAKLEKIVQAAAKKAGHNLTALSGDAGKKALACKGNVDCLAKIAAGKPGYAVVIVVWALKKKRLGEVALFDLATMKKVGGANGAIDAKLGDALVAAIPAPPPPPVEEVKVAAPAPEAAADQAAAPAQADAAGEAAEAKAEPAEAPEAAKEAPATAVKPSTGKSKTVPYALVGGGVLMAAAGPLFFGLEALNIYAELDDKNNPMTADKRKTREDEMKQAALTNDLLLFPGLIAAGAGAYLLLQ